ncbi:hypothetical protein N7517_009290 [Penicillium concentricum]|uniref:Uncharacterized protein n=1 Tax=Penicillium concentricum TaxID=293559 RepID=A0A9W9UXB1_9EURO|nr:uncharacterized protein N7517_009290 [Penicillium concentricum]KAJ5360099.1 hypothetical protein N7517_009290 [Penicillium concentricum]
MGIGTGGTDSVIRAEDLLQTIGWAGNERIPLAIAGFQAANNTRSRAIIGLTDAFTRNVILGKEADKRERICVVDKVGLRLDTDVDRKRMVNGVVIR